MKSDSGSGFSQIFDSGSGSRSEKTQNPTGVDFDAPGPWPPPPRSPIQQDIFWREVRGPIPARKITGGAKRLFGRCEETELTVVKAFATDGGGVTTGTHLNWDRNTWASCDVSAERSQPLNRDDQTTPQATSHVTARELRTN